MFARPEYDWVERQRLASWLVTQWQHLSNWLARLSEQYPIGFNIGLALTVLALVFLLVHIGYVIVRIVRPAVRTGKPVSAVTGGVIMDAAAHLRLARELALAGRYSEALGHHFIAVVLELDRRKALRFHASKTPAEYIGEVRLDESGRASFAGLVASLYRHLFGAVPCDADEYEAFGAAARDLARGGRGGPRVVPA